MWWYGAIPAHPPRSPEGIDARQQGRTLGAKKLGRWRRQDAHAWAELVKDTEAFLNGHLVERIESRAESVPAWTWTNLLAHGTVEDLHRESRSPRLRGVVKYRQWRQARSYLAAEVLDCTLPCGSLLEVQTSILVPLELQFASTAEVAKWSPGRWAVAVDAALTRRRLASWFG